MQNLINVLSELTDISNTISDKLVQKTGVLSADGIALSTKLTIIEQKLNDLIYDNAFLVNSEDDFNKPGEAVIISLDSPISGKSDITAAEITINKLVASDSALSVTAEYDVNISGYTSTGTLARSVSNAQLLVNGTGVVEITNSVMGQSGYNVIEIGLDEIPKHVIIDNVKFTAESTNNTISIFGNQENSVVTISNCDFAKCSNPVRLSNRGNNKVTVNIVNCNFTEWETTYPEFAGMIVCEDYTSKSAEAENANNLFGPDKLTINIVNCTLNGEAITNGTPEEIFGSKLADKQLLYVYYDKAGFVDYDPTKYPTVNIR